MEARASSAIPYLSVSKIKTFLMCPRRYKLQYIEKLVPEFRSAALAFGSAWHAAVGHFLLGSTGDTRVPNDELSDVFRASLERDLADDTVPVLFDDEESSFDELVKKAREMLEVFGREYALPDRVVSVEEPFVLELVDPATCEALDVPLVGAIDALIERAGKVLVMEVKSSKRKWSADQIEFDLQTTAYIQAARRLRYDDAEAELVITTKATKPTLQVERLARHPRDDRELAELAFGVVHAVTSRVFHRARGWQCRSCAYAGACAP